MGMVTEATVQFSHGCNNVTISMGMCNGLAVCGYCYGYIDEGGSIPEVATVYEHFNLIVIGILLPLIGLFGLIGDSISAFIYSRKEMQSSLNVYLCALACSDIIIILTAFFLFFLENMRKRSIQANRIFAILALYMFPIGLTAQSLSVFLTVTAAADCLILVAGSEKMKQMFCSVKSSLRMLAVIVLLAMVYNAPHLFEIYVIDCWSLPYNQPSKDVCPTDLRNNQTYVSIYYAWLYTIVMAAGPFVLLIFINSAIVFSLRRQKQNSNDEEDEEKEGSNGDVVTLILVVALFVTCNILPLTVNLLEMLLSIENPYLIDLSNLMVVVNSSCNFLIYYAFGSHFRRTLRSYLRRYHVALRRAASSRSVSVPLGSRYRRSNNVKISTAAFTALPVHSIVAPNKECLI